MTMTTTMKTRMTGPVSTSEDDMAMCNSIVVSRRPQSNAGLLLYDTLERIQPRYSRG